MNRALMLLLLIPIACSDPVREISDSGFGAFEVDLDVLPGRNQLVTTWYDTRHGGGEIYLRRLNSSLQGVGSERRVTMGTPDVSPFEPDVAVSGDRFAITWYERLADGRHQVQLALFDRNAELLKQSVISDPGRDGRIPVLVALDSGYFIAWVDSDFSAASNNERRQVVGLRLDSDINGVGQAQVLAQASATTLNLNAASQNDRIWLVFNAEFETGASEVYLVSVAADAVASQRLSADDNHSSTYPDIAIRQELAALS